MTSLEHPFNVQMARQFILDDRELAGTAPDFACWQPDIRTATVRHGAVPTNILMAARDSFGALAAGIKLEPVTDPTFAIVAKCTGDPKFNIDPAGPLDQPGSVVRISSENNETFTKFWERVGESLEFPDDASTQEIGLAAASGIEFDVIRKALARLQESPAKS